MQQVAEIKVKKVINGYQLSYNGMIHVFETLESLLKLLSQKLK